MPSTQHDVDDPLDRPGLHTEPLDRARRSASSHGSASSRRSSAGERVQLVDLRLARAAGSGCVRRPSSITGLRRLTSGRRGRRARTAASRPRRPCRPPGGGPGRGRRPRKAALGRHRGEPLVVGLDRHADHASQPLRLGPGSLRRRARRPPERLSGSPTTTHSASSAATSAAIWAWSCRRDPLRGAPSAATRSCRTGR